MKISDRKKIVFSILKEISENRYLPSYNDYNISKEDFVSVVKFMVKENYLYEDNVLFNILGDVEIDNEIDTITDKGLAFIEECEAWNKVYSDINDYKMLLNL